MKNHLARHLGIGLFAILLFAAPPGYGQERRQVPEARIFGTPANPDDATMLIVAFEAYKQAWEVQDTAALMALHASDTEWINAYARIFRGTEALSVFLDDRLFPQFSPEISKQEADNMTVISTRYIGADAAVIHIYTDGDRGPSVTKGHDLRRTHTHLIWEKQAGAWKIVHTAIMDAR